MGDKERIGMNPSHFNEAVISKLKSQGKQEVAEFARANTNNSRALGPSDVAREIGVARTIENVAAVANAVADGYSDSQSV